MEVEYVNLRAQFAGEKLQTLIKAVLERGQFILGPEVEIFEARFAQLCDSKHALGVASGTDALFLALKVLDIGPGDEVITVPNSFIATAGAIVAAGATPVFVDVGTDYTMDPGALAKAINRRTKAVIPVHLTGQPADMPAIVDIAQDQKLAVIEDAAQAVCASINGQKVGSFGDLSCFSLHPLKNLNVCGDGGVVTTNRTDLDEKIRLLRNHGLINRDEISVFGYNSRLDTFKAAVANHVMDHLPDIIEKRRQHAEMYDHGFEQLSDFITIPPRFEDVAPVFHTYVIQVNYREKLMAYLASCGIESKIHYPIPIHLQKPFRDLGYQKGDFPECERQSERILSLPVHQYLSEAQINHVIDCINDFYDPSGQSRKNDA